MENDWSYMENNLTVVDLCAINYIIVSVLDLLLSNNRIHFLDIKLQGEIL